MTILSQTRRQYTLDHTCVEHVVFYKFERFFICFVGYCFSVKIVFIIVNGDMVWKLGKFESVYNELRCYVESASPCTNLLKFCN